MKKILLIILVCLILVGLVACKKEETEPTAVVTNTPAPTATPQPEEEQDEITDATIYITVETDTDLVSEPKIIIPEQQYDVICSAKAGDKLELLSAGCEWHNVIFDGKEGFVKASDVSGVESLASPYYIYIEKGSHTINIYEMDANGKYTVLIETYLTATGKTAGKTPTGTFAIKDKHEWKQFDSAGTDQPYSYSPYVSSFTDGIYMHGPVFKEQDFNTMYGNTYKEIGTDSTAGCLRTNVGSAYWIYMNCPIGTTVEVVNGSPREIETPKLERYIHDLNLGIYIDPTDPNYEPEAE